MTYSELLVHVVQSAEDWISDLETARICLGSILSKASSLILSETMKKVVAAKLCFSCFCTLSSCRLIILMPVYMVPLSRDKMRGEIILVYGNESRLIIQQNVTIFLGVDYNTILGNQRMLKQQQKSFSTTRVLTVQLRQCRTAHLPKGVGLTTYCTKIRTLLEYATPVWGSVPLYLMNDLERVPRRIIIGLPVDTLSPLCERIEKLTSRH